jgi:hypothetical protein
VDHKNVPLLGSPEVPREFKMGGTPVDAPDRHSSILEHVADQIGEWIEVGTAGHTGPEARIDVTPEPRPLGGFAPSSPTL